MIAMLVAALAATQPVPPRIQPLPTQLQPDKAPTAAANATPAPARVAEPGVNDEGIEVAGAGAGIIRVPSNEQAFGGIQTPGAARLSERVADYELSATLDPDKHTVEGHEKLTWRNRGDRPVRSLYFHLYLNGFESRGSTFFTEMARYGQFRSGVKTKKGEWGYIELKKISVAIPLANSQGKEARWSYVHPDGGPDTDHSVVRVDLPDAVPPQGTATIDIDFHDQLPRVIARTGYFDKYHLVAQWFPKVGVLELPGERGATRLRWNCHEFHLNSEFYADFGNYRAQITVPKAYAFGSTGEETAPPRDTGQGTVHTVAQDDIHDFAFTAWDKFAPPLAGTARAGRVHVKVLYPPEMEESARIALQATIDALEYFSETLGEYPYRQVTCVVPPHNAGESGGMEYETFFTTIGATAQPGTGIVRYVTVHEFGHGYFMGLLATNEFEEPFLDEGLNEFWDARMLSNEFIQVTAPGLGRLGIRTPKISYWDFERGGTQRFQADPIAGNSWNRFSGGSYGLVYARTVMVFRDLEKRLGGDVMARAFKEYYRRFHHRHPSTADLRKTLEDVAGEQAPLVREWFDAQVYERAPVDDRVESLESEEVLPLLGEPQDKDGKRVELDEEAQQKEVGEKREAFKKAHPDEKERGPFPFRTVVQVRRYAFHVPQILVVKFADGTSEKVEWPAQERWHRFVWDKPVKAVSAEIDASREVLLDLNKLDDARTREPTHAAARRWTLEASAWTQLVFSLVEAL